MGHIISVLQEYGFEVYLVNAKHVKNATGRKDDESDAEWIQKLHSCGLLSASFQPGNMIRTLRSMVRHRRNLVQTPSTYLNRIQKALELMNIKVHTIISDIDGKTGLLMIEAILAGGRNPEVLADLRDKRIKASREEIQKQLAEQIASADEGVIPDIPKDKRKASGKHKVQFNLTGYLKNILDVDVTEVCGISELSALTITSEVGTDMSKWKNEHHFTSWLGLAPNTKISGGKVISSKIKKKTSCRASI